MTSPLTYGTLFNYLKNRIRKKESAEPFENTTQAIPSVLCVTAKNVS